MLEQIKALFADGFSIQDIVDLLKIILDKVLGHVAEEEGYDFPAKAE